MAQPEESKANCLDEARMGTCRASSGDQAGGRGREDDRVNSVDFLFAIRSRVKRWGLGAVTGDSFRMKGGISTADRCQ